MSQITSSQLWNSQSSQVDDVYKSKIEHELSCIFEDLPQSSPEDAVKCCGQESIEKPRINFGSRMKESDESEVSGADEKQLSPSTIGSEGSHLKKPLNIVGTPYKFFVCKPGLNRNQFKGQTAAMLSSATKTKVIQ